ncbi:MAG: 50S ribosomal protein L23 [Deltaproteobacteria bacterium]|nr:50S ribosomal protein L23 [Deltaproteobacteria bacterium]
MNISDVIKRPLITEKSTLLKGVANTVLFAVDSHANKKEVRDAVEKSFKVKVVDVRTMNVAGKTKRRGRTLGLRPGWKKAIVTLKEGDNIEFFEGV